MSSAHESGFEAKFRREGIVELQCFCGNARFSGDGCSQPIEASRGSHERVHVRLREACGKCKNAKLYSYPCEALSVNELPTPLILGWQEWVALPDLGLPALKAKIDTGARTSALHTHQIEPYGTAERPMVRFTVRPDPDREDLQIEARAAIIDQREVTSSNGERELRFVIETRLKLGEWEWPIEITLTNRERMAYRMLLGRQAIRPNVLVDPDAKFHQPVLGYELYGA